MTGFNQYGDNYGVNNLGKMGGGNVFNAPPVKRSTSDEHEEHYEPVEPDGEDFDFAFSFARSDRSYVERTRRACGRLGLRVMYDRDHSNYWWGRNFIEEQRRIYGARTRYFVPFISAEYLRRPIPGDEFAAATRTDIERGGGYILPVLIGDVRVPAHVLPRHIGFLKAENLTPEGLALELHRKVGQAATETRG